MNDRVATTRLYRMWAVPGLLDRDTVALDVGASVLGGLSSSRLDNALVRGEKLAVERLGEHPDSIERVGLYEVTADVRPGVDPAVVAKRLDEIIADFIRTGPNCGRGAARRHGRGFGRIKGLESVGGFGGKAVALAEGALYANDPDFYKTRSWRAMPRSTPAEVKAATAKWLSRPVYALTVAPGQRKAYEESPRARRGTQRAPNYYRTAAAGEQPLAPVPAYAPAADPQASGAADGGPGAPAKPFVAGRGGLPPVGPVANISFPAIQRDTLANGIPLIYAQRNAVPVTRDRDLVRCGQRRRSQGAAGHAIADAGAAGRGHEDAQLDADRRRAGAAGRDDRRGRLARPDDRVALRADAQSGAVARSARRYRPQSRLRARPRWIGCATSSWRASPPS